MTYKNGVVITGPGEIAMGNEADWIELFNDMMNEKNTHSWRYDEAMSWDSWNERVELGTPSSDSIVFNAADNEMLKVTQDGFWVRGVRVEQGPGEAEAVYAAFKEFMTWAIISRPVEE